MEPLATQTARKRSYAARYAVLAVMVLIAGLGVLLTFLSRAQEPVCNGKTLSQWAITLRSRDVRYQTPDGSWIRVHEEPATNSPQAEFAIQRIGTHGLPFLLDWLADAKLPSHVTWKQKTIDVLTKIPMPKKFQAGLRNSSFNAYPEQTIRPTPEDALWCFRILGSNAAPAIPQLAQIATQRDDWQASIRAVQTLGAIGPDSLPTLLDLATNYSCPSRRQIVITLTESAEANGDSQREVILRTLVRCVKDGDVAVERQAARAVGELKADPAVAFPVLTNGLHDPNLAYACVEGLAAYGETARPALGSLLTLMRSPDSELRDAASNAIIRISPESLGLPQQK